EQDLLCLAGGFAQDGSLLIDQSAAAAEDAARPVAEIDKPIGDLLARVFAQQLTGREALEEIAFGGDQVQHCFFLGSLGGQKQEFLRGALKVAMRVLIGLQK